MNPVAVELARHQVGEVGVPDEIGALGQRDPVRFLLLMGGIKETKLDLRRVLGEEGEVHSRAIPGGTQRIGVSRPDSHRSIPLR